MVDKVGEALIGQSAAGDKPKSISTPNLDISAGKKTLDSISGENDDEDAEEGEGMGGVMLPDPMALFGGANASVEEGATSAIGSTVSATLKNIQKCSKAKIIRNVSLDYNCIVIVELLVPLVQRSVRH